MKSLHMKYFDQTSSAPSPIGHYLENYAWGLEYLKGITIKGKLGASEQLSKDDSKVLGI